MKRELKKLKAILCPDCAFYMSCRKQQRNVMVCSDVEVLCCGKPMSYAQTNADIRHFVCQNRACGNAAVVRHADAKPRDELFQDGDMC